MPQTNGRVMKGREDVLKYVTSSDFTTGGFLPTTRQESFFKSVFDAATLLKIVRSERVPNPNHELPKFHFGGPITRGSAERTFYTPHNTAKPSMVDVSCQKVESHVAITMDALLKNVERMSFENTFISMSLVQIGTDFENLAINGNVTNYAAGVDPLSLLLKVLNGWKQKALSCHRLSAGGMPMQKEIFGAALRRFPKRYRTGTNWKANLRWLISDDLWEDWLIHNGARADALGLAALGGQAVDAVARPLGIQAIPVPLFDSDLSLSVAEATSAWVVGTGEGPFKFTATTKVMLLDVDNGGATTITFDEGVHMASQVARKICDEVGAEVAWGDSRGRLVIRSMTTGASSEVDIQTVANHAYTELGLTVAVTPGAAAGGGGSSRIGSFMWLTDPLNLIWAMFDKTRYSRQYDQDLDEIRAVWYNYIDAEIQETDMLVQIEDVRVRQYV